jgi:hypothetical protein
MKNLNKRIPIRMGSISSNAGILLQHANRFAQVQNTAHGRKDSFGDMNRLFGGLLNNFVKHNEKNIGNATNFIGGLLNNAPKYASAVSSIMNDGKQKYHDAIEKTKPLGFLSNIVKYAENINVRIGSDNHPNSTAQSRNYEQSVYSQERGTYGSHGQYGHYSQDIHGHYGNYGDNEQHGRHRHHGPHGHP